MCHPLRAFAVLLFLFPVSCGALYDAGEPAYDAVVDAAWGNHLLDGDHPWHAGPGTAAGFGVQAVLALPSVPFAWFEHLLGAPDPVEGHSITKGVVYLTSGVVATTVALGAFAMTLPDECASHHRVAAEKSEQ